MQWKQVILNEYLFILKCLFHIYFPIILSLIIILLILIFLSEIDFAEIMNLCSDNFSFTYLLQYTMMKFLELTAFEHNKKLLELVCSKEQKAETTKHALQ